MWKKPPKTLENYCVLLYYYNCEGLQWIKRKCEKKNCEGDLILHPVSLVEHCKFLKVPLNIGHYSKLLVQLYYSSKFRKNYLVMAARLMRGNALCTLPLKAACLSPPGGHPSLRRRPHHPPDVEVEPGPWQLLHPLPDGPGGPAGHRLPCPVLPLRLAAPGPGSLSHVHHPTNQPTTHRQPTVSFRRFSYICTKTLSVRKWRTLRWSSLRQFLRRKCVTNSDFYRNAETTPTHPSQ